MEPTSAYKTVFVQVLAPGQQATVPPADNQSIKFAFALADASFSRDGVNLIITLVNGATLTLQNFFTLSPNHMPQFWFGDEQEVSGKKLLTDLGFDLAEQLKKKKASPSSGLEAYQNSAGDLMSGVEGTPHLTPTHLDQAAVLPASLITPIAPVVPVPVKQDHPITTLTDYTSEDTLYSVPFISAQLVESGVPGAYSSQYTR